MHVNSDQKRLLLLPFFHYHRLPFYRLKADNEKLYNRLFYARSKRSGHVPRSFYSAELKWTELKGALKTVETSLGTVYGMLTYIQQCGSKIREINKTSSHFKSTGFFFGTAENV